MLLRNVGTNRNSIGLRLGLIDHVLLLIGQILGADRPRLDDLAATANLNLKGLRLVMGVLSLQVVRTLQLPI